MLYKEYPNFDNERFVKEVFNDGSRDPFNQRLADIRSWRDVPSYFGLSPMQVDEAALKDGFMSAKLYDVLAEKLGKERLDSYFGMQPKAKLTKAEQELDDLATLLVGNVRDTNRISVIRFRK